MRFYPLVTDIFVAASVVMALPFDFQAGADVARAAAAAAGKTIGEQIQAQIDASGIKAEDCVGSTSTLCIEAGFSEDPFQ
ncbi:hypothetical protein CEP54_011510 [Fusarium duplospermum]|uniref:Uncharacterized protein n=1 Tax=Fusarium duplospermum TaxID=1325734 RepID=A0A428PE35_9HYPO|nr:hypothetical protein CEP54_011510 [Fusarium duplospermum]